MSLGDTYLLSPYPGRLAILIVEPLPLRDSRGATDGGFVFTKSIKYNPRERDGEENRPAFFDTMLIAIHTGHIRSEKKERDRSRNVSILSRGGLWKSLYRERKREGEDDEIQRGES